MSVARLIAKAAAEPHYLLGRFPAVRRGYSNLRRIGQMVRGRQQSLGISEHYGDDVRPIAVNRSGLVSSAVDATTHVSNLERYAVSAGLELTQPVLEHLTHLANRLPLVESGAPLPSLEEIRRDGCRVALATVTQASYDPMLQAVLADATLFEVARMYLGYRPSRVEPWLFWSFANDLSIEAREARYQTVRFHYDVHSYNFMYVNFYLTDTDERSGAHVLIQGSHREKRWRHLLGSARLSDEQARDDYGESRIRAICGAARSGFFEDTSCYHKAIPPLDRDRLMLQIRYQ
jgi:hypothetical protein